MKLIYLLSCLILIGCGSKSDDVIFQEGPFKRRNSDSTFNKYIDTFETYSNKNVTTPILFDSEMGVTTVGLCTKWLLNGNVVYKEITVNNRYWDSISEEKREHLILHELGHCELNKEHNNKMLTNSDGLQYKASIMHAYAFNNIDIQEYIKDFNYYIEELLDTH